MSLTPYTVQQIIEIWQKEKQVCLFANLPTINKELNRKEKFGFHFVENISNDPTEFSNDLNNAIGGIYLSRVTLQEFEAIIKHYKQEKTKIDYADLSKRLSY